MTNDKVWMKAYQNRRNAQLKYDLMLSRFQNGLCLVTGYRPAEQLRLAELQTKLREVEFQTVTAGADPNAIADAAIVLLHELESERANEGKTPEYNRAFQSFAADALETLSEIVKRYQPQTEAILD